MADTRRGFLKTLGKLTAAVGITAAAATVLPAKSKGIGDPGPLASIKVPGGKPIIEDLTYKTASVTRGRDTLILPNDLNKFVGPHGQIKFMGNVTVTNRDKFFGFRDDYNDKTDPIADAQKAIDNLNNLRIDNERMGVLPHHYFFDKREHRERALRELDPYNWRGVYDLKWEDWKQRDPAHDTITGIWLATVRPYFEPCFEKPCYYRSVTVTKMALLMSDAEEIKKIAQDNGYREIVRSLQDEILNRIKRDVRSRT